MLRGWLGVSIAVVARAIAIAEWQRLVASAVAFTHELVLVPADGVLGYFTSALLVKSGASSGLGARRSSRPKSMNVPSRSDVAGGGIPTEVAMTSPAWTVTGVIPLSRVINDRWRQRRQDACELCTWSIEMPEPNHDTARVHNVDAELISGRFICSAGSFRRARPDQVVPRPTTCPSNGTVT